MPVTLAGAGCGSPRLLTEAARAALERADHVVYDRLIHPDLLQLAPAACRFHLVGKRESDHTLSQDGINRLLVELGREKDKNIVRLKGGDPFVFGRGGEEASALEAAGIAWTAIPGVTAALGGALCAGLPITHRGLASSVTLATGHRRGDLGEEADETDEKFWQEVACASGTTALYMGASAFAGIAARLIALGKSPGTPAAAVVWGGWGRVRKISGTLAGLGETAKKGELPSPAIVYIGGAAAVELSPARGPLVGLQVAVCRPYPECWVTGRALEELGADSYGLPLLVLEPLEPADAAHARRTIEGADWLVITSPRGPGELRRLVPDLRAIRGRVVSIGEGTSRALREIGIVADVTADGTSDGLAEVLAAHINEGESVVFARNERGSHVAVQAAEVRGATVKSIATYRMSPRAVPGLEVMREQWSQCGVDAVVYGSAAMVEEYKAILGDPPETAALIAWGSVCAKAIEENFGQKAIKLREPSVAGLIEILKKRVMDETRRLH